jgi:hypothetical protein
MLNAHIVSNEHRRTRMQCALNCAPKGMVLPPFGGR